MFPIFRLTARLAGVRIGRIDGRWVMNPTQSQLAESDTDIFLSGSKDAIVMVEGGAQIVPEEEILEALFAGHEAIQPLLQIQEEIRRALGQSRSATCRWPSSITRCVRRVEELALGQAQAGARSARKARTLQTDRRSEERSRAAGAGRISRQDKKISKAAFEELKKNVFRGLVIQQERRIDGRGLKDIRPITCEVEVLPRTHGSALFTRGETQALVVTTLGTASDEQRVDALIGEHFKKFMLHYNFPPFSVGEVKFLRGPGPARNRPRQSGRARAGSGAAGRRELSLYHSHRFGNSWNPTARPRWRACAAVRLSLMDAGVPVTAPVAGIAMGLIKEGEHVRVLSDILGDEDHLGDMDFKVAGTAEGVTSLQMDIKISGVNRDVMGQALHQAKEGRMHILGIMNETLIVGAHQRFRPCAAHHHDSTSSRRRFARSSAPAAKSFAASSKRPASRWTSKTTAR